MSFAENARVTHSAYELKVVRTSLFLAAFLLLHAAVWAFADWIEINVAPPAHQVLNVVTHP